MTFKQFFLAMFLATLIVWLIWLFILFKIDPTVSGRSGFLFFYCSLGMGTIGTLTMTGMIIRRLIRNQDLISRQVMVSFRQAVWLSMIILISLFLLSEGLFRLWIISLVIAVFSLIELAFLSARRVHRHD